MALNIRPAEYGEIEKLILISKKAFPKSIKENIPKNILKKYWEKLLNSNSGRIFILNLNGDVIAYYHMVVDISKYKNEFGKKLPISFKILLFIGRILSIIIIFISRNMTLRELFEIMFSRISKNNVGLTKPRIEVQNECLCWCEAIAISPQCQNMGYGKILIEHAINECNKLHKKTFGATVIGTNTASKRLFSSMGFNECQTEQNLIIFKKDIEVFNASE